MFGELKSDQTKRGSVFNQRNILIDNDLVLEEVGIGRFKCVFKAKNAHFSD